MFKFSRAALCAAVFLCAQQAEAAQYLAVDITAKGSGYANVGSRSGNTPTRYFSFEDFGATLFYNLSGTYAPTETASGLSLVGSITEPLVTGNTTALGFSFSAVQPLVTKLSYRLTGNACYANNTPTQVPSGFFSADPSCSALSIDYGDGAAAFGYSFTGSVTGVNFRVVDADFLPGVVFAIPEPSTWALMLAGFGMVGYAIRRRRSGTTALA